MTHPSLSVRSIFATVAVVLGGLGTTLAELPCYAQSTGVTTSAGGLHAVANEQARELGVGVWGQASFDLPLASGIVVGPSVLALGMAKGDLPRDPSLAAREAAYFVGFGLAGRVRPFARSYNEKKWNASGFWVGSSLGISRTADLTRPYLQASLGFDVWIKPTWAVGPQLSYLWVPQPDSSYRPDDAHLGLVGLHVAWDRSVATRAKARTSATRDQDHDGILDDVDACPTEPEDKDGFEDDDGCPDFDNDGDGIPDIRDKCPNQPEDKDGFEDNDGCPELDNDKDGIPDAKDACPNEPEDKDGFEDNDGCPDPDNDGDGIPDIRDKCPNEPETKNGYADEDGCPDEQSVRVVGDQLVLDDRIYFRINMAVILPRSFGLLQRLASFLTKHPEYIRMSIEGHTDIKGSDSYNRKLSESRADSVRTKLISFGLAPARLTVVGYGSEKPQVDAHDEGAYQKNRRVEFRVFRENNELVPESKIGPLHQGMP